VSRQLGANDGRRQRARAGQMHAGWTLRRDEGERVEEAAGRREKRDERWDGAGKSEANELTDGFSQEKLRALSERAIEEAMDRLEKENPTNWMADRNVFEKVKLDVECVCAWKVRPDLREGGLDASTNTCLCASRRNRRERIMRAVDVEVWSTLEAPEQREEILRQVEEALGSSLLRR